MLLAYINYKVKLSLERDELQKMKTETRLKQLRKERKISGYKMAERLGVSPQYYYELERGEKRLNQELIEKISDIFGVSADFLIGRDDEEEQNIDVKKLFEDAGFKRYHWDGVPLDEEALKEAKQVIEYFLWKKTGKKR